MDGTKNLVPLRLDRYSYLYHSVYLRNVIRACIEANNLSIKNTAEESAVDRGDLSRYLSGKRKRYLSDINLLKVCAHLGLDVELLVKFNGNAKFKSRK